MKTILEDVQLAIAGTGEDGRVISGDLLRIIASNFKGNQYPQILKGSLREKAKTHEFVGYVTSVYFKECDGESALFGDLEFFQFYDMSTLKETFANGVYPAIEIINSHPGYESLYRLAFTNKPFIKGLRMVNFRNCVCVGREEQTQEKLDSESEFLFNKKYDNEKSGFIGYVKNNDNIKKQQAVRLISSFIPAINMLGKDEKSIDLIRRIIIVVGASENCRQDEIEAAYIMSLEKLIDRLVRDWHAAFQPSS